MRSIKSTDRREPVVVYFDIELDDMSLTPYEYRAYGRIARRASGGQRACTESLEAMAQGCQMSRPTLVRAIRGLISRRMIERESKLGDTSTYYLTDKACWVGGSPDAQGVDQTFTRGGKPEIQGGGKPEIHKEDNTSRQEEDKGRKPSAATPPAKPETAIDDLGDILEDAYPGYATNWKTMRDLRELIDRLHATRSDVLAFPGWLQHKYPLKANTPFSFKDLFPQMVRESNATKPQASPSYCGECNHGWTLTESGATQCQCQRSTNNENSTNRTSALVSAD